MAEQHIDSPWCHFHLRVEFWDRVRRLCGKYRTYFTYEYYNERVLAEEELTRIAARNYVDCYRLGERFKESHRDLYLLKRQFAKDGLQWYEVPNELALTYDILLKLKREIRRQNENTVDAKHAE